MTTPWRHGYSLVELVVCVAILGIILLGAQSAVMISSRAMPGPSSISSQTIVAAQVLDSLAKELAYATSFATMSSNALEFTMSDQTGDGVADIVRYEWSGIAGQPLTRRFNNGSIQIVLPSVASFQLTFDKVATAQPTTFTESSETLLSNYTTSSSLGDEDIKNNNWVAQIFRPSLPSDAVQWRVTRIFVYAERKGGTSGIASVQLRPIVNGVPVATVLTETQLLESAIPSDWGWVQISTPNGGQLGASASLCIVIKWIFDTDACRVRKRNNLLLGPSEYMLKGMDGNWNATNDTLLYYVYGTVTTPNPTTYLYSLRNVSCEIQPTAQLSSKLSTTVRILNQPQVSGP